MLTKDAMRKHEKTTYNIRLVFEGEEVEKLMRVMAYYRITSAKKFFYELFKHTYQEVMKQEKQASEKE